MGNLDGPNNRILQADTRVQEQLQDLVSYGDKHLGLKIKTKVDGLMFYYEFQDKGLFMRRILAVHVPGWKIEDISEDELARIQTAIMNVIVMPGNKIPDIQQPSEDCLMFIQDFVPEIAVERKPGLVSIAGGFGGKDNA